jgi:excisionase family DNA binding protein
MTTSDARGDPLADLLAAVERAAGDAPSPALIRLIADLERVRATLWQRLLLTAAAQAAPAPRDSVDDLPHLTPTQAAELLSLKPAYVHELCRTGRIPATKSGKYWMVSVAGLRRWLVSTNRDVDAVGRGRLESLNPRGDTGPRPSAAPSRPPRRALTTS